MDHPQILTTTPIFVVGTPRSGTTLTARILGNHSRILMPGETHFFDDIYSRWRDYGPLYNSKTKEEIIERLSTLYGRYNEPQDQDRIDTLLGSVGTLEKLRDCNNYKEIFSCFMQMQMDIEGKSRWGNQTPRDIFNVREIISFYPEAKIIVCIRDIRDFLLSYKNKWRVTIKENKHRIKGMYHPIITSFLWRASIQQLSSIKHIVPSNNLFILKYEDLVKNPGKKVELLCNFIEEQFEPEMMTIGYQNSSFESQTYGIFTQSVGRWRKALNNEEVVVSQIICGQEMNSYGYEKENVKYSLKKIVCICLSTFTSFFSIVKANKPMRGSLLAYLGRRLAPLFFKGK